MATAAKAIGDLETISVAELESQIRHHNKLYWEEQAPEISDYDYDRLVLRLKELAPASPVLLDLGESKERLGDPVQHKARMLSLDKCYSEMDLNEWASKIAGDFVVMPKFDGIACSLRYDGKGKLELAATRGDGIVGDDVTVNALGIKDIPRKVGTPDVEVRGEVYMRLSVFQDFKAQFSNPRNLTAGAMKQKDQKKSAGYRLSFAGYDVLGAGAETEKQKFEWLKAQGFPSLEVVFVPHGQLQKAYEEFAAKRPFLDFEIDGVVFRANEVSEQGRLGFTAHHPRFALAYKFQGESGRTTLKDVEWSVSRTGVITPVALVEPVQLSGALVSRASLHHAGFVKKLDLTKNCEVLVTRRGGVIPNVERMIKPGDGPLDPPAHCPSCGTATHFEDDFLFCSNVLGCRAQVLGELEDFCGVTEMLGFGESILSHLFDAGLVKGPADFYDLKAAQLESLERLGKKSAANLIAQVDARRELALDVFLRSLGVHELGKHVSALLAQRYGDLDRIRAITIEELAAVHSVGEVIARSVVEGLKQRAPLIDALLKHVHIIAAPQQTSEGPFKGRSFVFTGKLEAMDRKVAQEEVRKLGAETPSSVGPALSYLVQGLERDGAKSSKQKAAEKFNAKGSTIEVLDEGGFQRLLEQAKKGGG